jgi:hypothetical protein
MLMTVFFTSIDWDNTHRRGKTEREFIYDCAEIRRRNNNKGWRERETLKNLQAHSSGAKKPKRKCRPSMPCTREFFFRLSLKSIKTYKFFRSYCAQCTVCMCAIAMSGRSLLTCPLTLSQASSNHQLNEFLITMESK